MCILKGGNSTLFYFVSKRSFKQITTKKLFFIQLDKKEFLLFYSIFSVDDSGVAVGDGVGVESGLSFAT